jgi:SAM-dependent methyltransferase
MDGPVKRVVRRWTRSMLFRALQDNPGISAKSFAFEPGKHSFVIPNAKVSSVRNSDAQPVPPKDLWLGYAETSDVYLGSGKADIEKMRQVLIETGFSLASNSRILDLGCGAGRMIRWLGGYAVSGEVWGCDISAQHVIWCQQNLSPPFNFSSITTSPHLPFEDRYFDLIYAGSVFTHISELVDAWLLELRRVLRPGGRAYITIHDKHSLEIFKRDGHQNYQNASRVLETTDGHDFGMLVVDRSIKGVQVYYDIDFLQRAWGRFFEIVAVEPEAYHRQTAVVLGRPSL